MKTMQAGAVVLLGLVLAAPAWGHSPSYGEQVPGSVSVAVNGHIVTVGWSSDSARAAVASSGGTCFIAVYVGDVLSFPGDGTARAFGTDWIGLRWRLGPDDWPQSVTLPDRWHGRKGEVWAYIHCRDAGGPQASPHFRA